MSPEESDKEATSSAVAAPVPESTEGEQPPVSAVPVAPAKPYTEETRETTADTDTPLPQPPKEEKNEEPVEPEIPENKEEVTAPEAEESSTPPPPTAPPPTTKPQHDYNYPPPAPQKQQILGVPMGELPYPFFLHNNFLMMFIFIGMLFTLIGGILSGSAIISSNLDIYGASVITISIGLFTVSTFLILAALFREDLDHFIRLGFLITGAFGIFGMILYSRFGFGVF